MRVFIGCIREGVKNDDLKQLFEASGVLPNEGNLLFGAVCGATGNTGLFDPTMFIHVIVPCVFSLAADIIGTASLAKHVFFFRRFHGHLGGN